jgi:hypothetical protein
VSGPPASGVIGKKGWIEVFRGCDAGCAAHEAVIEFNEPGNETAATRHPFYLSYMAAFLGVAVAFPSLLSGACACSILVC